MRARISRSRIESARLTESTRAVESLCSVSETASLVSGYAGTGAATSPSRATGSSPDRVGGDEAAWADSPLAPAHRGLFIIGPVSTTNSSLRPVVRCGLVA